MRPEVRAVLGRRRRRARRRDHAQDARPRGRRARAAIRARRRCARSPSRRTRRSTPTCRSREAFAFLEEQDFERVPGRRGREARRRALALGRAAAARRGRAAGRARGVSLGGDERGLELAPASVASARASCARTSSSTRWPSSSNFSAAWPTATSTSATRAPIAASTLRSSAWAQTAPNMPALEPITATGLLRNDVRRERARGPVERVLERARDRRVVLGRRDQDGVGLGDRRRAARRPTRAPARRRRPGRTAARRAARPRRRARRSGGEELPRGPQQQVLCESRRRLPEMARIRIATLPSPARGRPSG